MSSTDKVYHLYRLRMACPMVPDDERFLTRGRVKYRISPERVRKHGENGKHDFY